MISENIADTKWLHQQHNAGINTSHSPNFWGAVPSLLVRCSPQFTFEVQSGDRLAMWSYLVEVCTSYQVTWGQRWNNRLFIRSMFVYYRKLGNHYQAHFLLWSTNHNKLYVGTSTSQTDFYSIFIFWVCMVLQCTFQIQKACTTPSCTSEVTNRLNPDVNWKLNILAWESDKSGLEVRY